MWTDLWDLFIAFLRASNLGFGGGQAMIPLIQEETVNRYQWLTNVEFSNSIAVSNALPGPMATKLASYIGYQVASWPGVLVALIATTLPTILVIIILGNLLAKYASSPNVQAMFKGVKPIITVLLAIVAYKMAYEAFQIRTAIDYVTFIIALGSAAALYFLKIHPAFLIIASLFVGYLVF